MANTAYVANYRSNTVSVINGTDGSYRNIANVTVGERPSSIAVNAAANIAYVANSGSDTVSVINGTDGSYRNIANVTVGSHPRSIAIDEFINDDIIYDIIYVANYGSTVSVINGTDGSYRNIANVTVGSHPRSIDVAGFDNIAYVANEGSDTVSVIYGPSQKVQAGVSFNVNPFHAGHIECNNIEVPTNQYFFVDFRTQCLAQANKGFQFSNWIENLGSKSSRTINESGISGSPVDSFMTALGIGPKDTSANLAVTKFGNFTANFQAVPPAIPPEYWIPLYGIILSTIIGWSIPSIIGWVKSRRDNGRLYRFHKRIKSLYKNGKLDQNDIESLDKLKSDIDDAYAKGKITDQHYDWLNKKIESSDTTSDNKTNHDNIGTDNQTQVSRRSPI